MDDIRKRQIASGPCEAELVWFDVSSLFYRELTNRGKSAALEFANRALAAIRPADMQQRAADEPFKRDGAQCMPAGEAGASVGLRRARQPIE